MIKRYKINQRNSTVCGYPGRDFDWSKFDWEGKTVHKAIFRGDTDMQAPKPHVDDFLIGEGNQYLHVPYDFAKQETIYRVRPNESMRAGKVYRGKLVLSARAAQLEDGWYWELELK